VSCLGLKSGTLGGTARHESLFVPRRAVPNRAVPRRAWAGSCRAAHLAIYTPLLASPKPSCSPSLPRTWMVKYVAAHLRIYGER